MKKAIRFLAALSLLVILFSSVPVCAMESPYCIVATPAITDATYEYLNEIYIEKFPDFALEYSYGSERDKNTLKTLADSITAGLNDDKKKTDAIVDWVEENIEYMSFDSGEAEHFAIDTYYEAKGNCVGISQLIVQLCRLEGIRAVMAIGSRGDMKDYLTLDSRVMDHAWAMIYFNNDWYLYDPLFSVKGTADRDFISKWYFTDMIEGVSPYVEEYLDYISKDTGKLCVYYVDGRFMLYKNGKPSSDFFGSPVQSLSSINGVIPRFSYTRDDGSSGNGYDGYEYVENPERKDAMINNECYSNGWVTYGTSLMYANPNGIIAGSTMKEYDGNCYYMPFSSGALKCTGSSLDYTFTEGFLTLMKGSKIYLEPAWVESELNSGKVLSWKNQTPDTISVSENGEITALSDGYACVLVLSKDHESDESHYYSTFVEVWVSSEERVFTPKPKPEPEPKPEPTPDVEIKDTSAIFTDVKEKGWYKEYVDYVASYGLMNGTSTTTFAPDTTMTRSMLVTILARMAGADTDSLKNTATAFTDVPTGKWYSGAVVWAVQNGITTGTSATTFAPDTAITREDICVFFVRYAQKAGINLKTDVAKTAFPDDAKIGSWAKNAVYDCQQAGIVAGTNEGVFNPKGNATRSAVAKIVTVFHKDYMQQNISSK